MDKAISDEERLRKAIEISQRRNDLYNRHYTNAGNIIDYHPNYKLFKKMILQIIICLLIYLIYYLITTTNYIFSNDIILKTKNILEYDIDIGSTYSNCIKFINSQIDRFNKKTENSEIKNEQFNNTIENNIEIENENNAIIDSNTTAEIKNDENIINNNTEEIENEKTQMEKDAEEVKKICKLEKPLSGKITSEFGAREVTSKVMSSDHKGIDIAANLGTEIKSAMSGTVTVSEQNSEYGKFIKIEKDDVMTVYAHCKTLNVKKGDEVEIGQTIATVGSTGNSTGPHLHFEIRLSGRFINPRYLIEF